MFNSIFISPLKITPRMLRRRLILSVSINDLLTVMWITTLVPLVGIIILAIERLTLPNAFAGVRFYVVPDWEKRKSW